MQICSNRNYYAVRVVQTRSLCLRVFVNYTFSGIPHNFTVHYSLVLFIA